ncbi:MAG: molybdopterin oxidoreductase family protein, partial [Cyanobacteria bacterium]|nr:molybdopterin oxidoreductase family protein [Cyanobacteriota bacterium]MDW8203208.1 molybdopterin oxidoreductase family protein [Cyanobacteriota bacterium SKYGB_h_bin112]
TTEFAHLLLPATQWSEKTGTMTNSERRVTLCPAFQPPKGEAKEDWAIFAEVGRRLGFSAQFPFTTAAEVHAEFVQLTAGRPCDMSGISYDRLRQCGPLQWPLPAQVIGDRCGVSEAVVAPHFPSDTCKRLYTDLNFPTPDGRARFVGYHAKGLAEPPDQDYPYILTNGRLYGHWHTQTRTGRVEKTRQMHSHPFIEIHPRDAEALGITTGMLVEVRSRRGRGQFPALITTAITPGTVFVPMHWGSLWADGAEANALTHPAACPDSGQPELKACAVQLRAMEPPGKGEAG